MNVNTISLEDSWASFAGAYGFLNKPNDFFKSIKYLSKIHKDKENLIYPYLLLPSYINELINVRFVNTNKSDEGITFNDLRNIAKDYELDIPSGNWDDIPVFPKESLIEPKRKTIFDQYIINVRYELGKRKYMQTRIVSSDLSLEDKITIQNGFDNEYKRSLEIYKKAKMQYQKYGNLFSLQRDIIDKKINLITRIYLYNQMLVDEEDLIIEKNVPIRGNSEDSFFSYLMERFPKYVKINRKKGPYYPDIVLCVDDYNYIDIEIDEPYELFENKEIHYIGCGDEDRNDYFTSKGWFVLRFSEQNIIDNVQECVQLIEDLIAFLEECKSENLKNFIEIQRDICHPQWTIEEARLMRIKKIRKKRLPGINNEGC